MQRIDTATKAPDLFGTGKHGYRNGNVSLGVLATQLNAAIFNSMQEEIAGVIEAAGITLNPASYSQLLSALTAGWDLPKSIGLSGYQKLPGGIIVQWMSLLVSNVANGVSASLPVTFPNAAFLMVCTPADWTADVTSQFLLQSRALTTSTFTVRNFGTHDTTAHCIAIGH